MRTTAPQIGPLLLTHLAPNQFLTGLVAPKTFGVGLRPAHYFML